MLERKEHKKMYKSGKNWAVVTLSTAALVFGATTVNAPRTQILIRKVLMYHPQ
ncbi:KxYKxGKxW signal peptide domain-containing protein [Limosilactobacillus agrestis]|uniref:KxYKxGKxW signal peptide domain-containing protein n=1 Tax=Limosilactobacillus agrestis TaxID=2759748 RepID=UPI0039E105B1